MHRLNDDESLRHAPAKEYASFSNPKKLRACYFCHLVKTQTQFAQEGCDNCQFFNPKDFTVAHYTSPHFESVVSIIDTQESWVALHLGLEQLIPGTYCRKIRDEPAGDIIQKARASGMKLPYNNN